jgi:steroid 5-alpha reductase family enzyme
MTALIFLTIVVAVSVSLSAIMTGAWLVWNSTRNSGWIDTTWTFGLGAVGCAGAFTPSLLTGGVTIRQVLVSLFRGSLHCEPDAD